MNDWFDSGLIPEGCERCSPVRFYFWQVIWLAVIGWGLLGAFLCLYKGLNQTGLTDYFGFGLWITIDLGVIALGAGAFSSAFMLYVLRKDDLKDIIGAATIIGFLCYSGAVGMLGIDIGQPLRGWFGFWHAQVHSMLTEVMFCITTYLVVLIIEYLPLILENRKLDEISAIHHFSHNLHEIMLVFACCATFLSFFHQGSLGGLYGVMYARPFAARTGFLIWPWTFFLFILSSVASGPALTLTLVWLTEKVTGKRLVRRHVLSFLGKVAGIFLTIYMALKIIDTAYWAFVQMPSYGQSFWDMFNANYPFIMLIAELGIFGVIPAAILMQPKLRDRDFWLITAAVMDCIGIVINRYVFTVQTLAIPVYPFDTWALYHPTWQEWAISFAMIAYGVLIYSLSYRYLPVFPRERELNP